MKYFEKPGTINTEESLDIAFEEALKRGIKHIVIASTHGDTAEKALPYLQNLQKENFNMVVVTHNTGFKELGVQEFSSRVKEMIEQSGGRVFTGSMPTRTLGRAIKNKAGFSGEDIATSCWRMFGEGTKVCIEIATMACDAGLVPPEDIIVVAGTGKGADTVILLNAMPSSETFKIKMKEFLAKPRDW
jgi:hypothetical protein